MNRVARRILPWALMAITGAGVLAPTAASLAAAGHSSLVTPVSRELAGGPMVHKEGSEDFSTPAVGALQGPGSDDAVSGFSDGSIHAWNLVTGKQFLAVNVDDGSIEASPAIVTIHGTTLILDATLGGLVFLMTPQGKIVFRYNVPDPHGKLTGVFGTPVIAYLDANSTPWIVFSSWNQELSAINLSGHQHAGFPYFFKDTSWSSPAVAYFNGSKYPTIVVGYDCGGGGSQLCHKTLQKGGYLTAINHVGQVEPGWPYFVKNQVVWSSPAIGHLTGSASSQDIVVGTGQYFTGTAGDELIALTPEGRLLPGWPVRLSSTTMGAPAIAFVDGHGYVADTQWNGHLNLISAAGRLLWSHCPFFQSNIPTCPDDNGGVSIGDLTDSGQVEVIGESNAQWAAYTLSGHEVAHEGVAGSLGLASTPVLTSVEGHATLLISSVVKGGADGQTALGEFTFPNPLGALAWATFKHDNIRSGDALGR